jgi:hypothetical protein
VRRASSCASLGHDVAVHAPLGFGTDLPAGREIRYPRQMPTISLTRQQLYDRAWTTPLDALAKELGLSGRGLGKLCDRHDIPVPPRGRWTKKTAGHRVRQTPLPAASAGMATSITFAVPEGVEATNEEEPQLHPLVGFE